MATTMVRESGVTPWSTVEEGAEAILNLASRPLVEGRSGRYFDGLEEFARQRAGLRRRGAGAAAGAEPRS